MKKIVFMLAVLATTSLNVLAQGAKNVKINEVMTNNVSSIEDEYGQREAWIELCNASFSTFNVRGMYITTNKKVLDQSLSAPQRQQLMSLIPSGEDRTQLTARKHIVFYCNSNPKSGSLHLTTAVAAGQPTWVALYDGNGVDLIDSVSVPALKANQSYARVKDGSKEWQVCDSAVVTPDIANSPIHNEKIARTKAEDPHGFAITILAMGTVFTCLALLYVFFRLLGIFMDRLNASKKAEAVQPVMAAAKPVEKVEEKSSASDNDVYMAVIAMALKQYQDDIHDEESGIITIAPRHTNWNNRIK